MQYIGFIFGIFGLLAYLELSSLKKRINDLERQMTAMQGTSYHEDRKNLVKVAQSYFNQKVDIDLKEDHQDVDIMMYGNSRHGSNIILDADEEWMLLRIETPKDVKTKLIRLESVARISLRTED